VRAWQILLSPRHRKIFDSSKEGYDNTSRHVIGRHSAHESRTGSTPRWIQPNDALDDVAVSTCVSLPHVRGVAASGGAASRAAAAGAPDGADGSPAGDPAAGAYTRLLVSST